MDKKVLVLLFFLVCAAIVLVITIFLLIRQPISSQPNQNFDASKNMIKYGGGYYANVLVSSVNGYQLTVQNVNISTTIGNPYQVNILPTATYQSYDAKDQTQTDLNGDQIKNIQTNEKISIFGNVENGQFSVDKVVIFK